MPWKIVGAPLPPDLLEHRARIDEYVQFRISQFASAFAQRYLPQMLPHQVESAARDIVHTLPEPGAPETSSALGLSLVFRHECLALGCRDLECPICQFNPVRLCERNFGKKYLVGDVLKAKCGASIRAEVLDGTGQLHEEHVSGVHFEVILVDGVTFKEKGGETRTLSEDELKACFKTSNHKDEALLQHKAGATGNGRCVTVKFEKGQATLPDLQVTDSSEALLTGRRPPFRLCVFAVQNNGQFHPEVRYAVSEEFVVATRRVKQANKADIPLVDDHISKIEHIGRETVKKLTDMRAAAAEIGVEMSIPDSLANIQTVGQFQQLVYLADTDAQLRKGLQVILKLSKEKWEEASNHAIQAVVPDFRKRVWYPPGHNMGIGLLFSCKYGAVQLRDPVALVQTQQDGRTNKVVPEDQLDPASLTILRQLKSQAVRSWWTASHPGWGVFQEPPTEGAHGAEASHTDTLNNSLMNNSLKSSTTLNIMPPSPHAAAGKHAFPSQSQSTNSQSVLRAMPAAAPSVHPVQTYFPSQGSDERQWHMVPMDSVDQKYVPETMHIYHPHTLSAIPVTGSQHADAVRAALTPSGSLQHAHSMPIASYMQTGDTCSSGANSPIAHVEHSKQASTVSQTGAVVYYIPATWPLPGGTALAPLPTMLGGQGHGPSQQHPNASNIPGYGSVICLAPYGADVKPHMR